MKTLYLSAAFLVAFFGASLAQSTQPIGGDIIATLKDGRSIDELKGWLGTKIEKQIPGTNIYLIHFEGQLDQALKRARADNNVESAEIDREFRLNPQANPSRTFSGLSTDTVFLLDGTTKTNFYGSEVLRAYVEQPALWIVQADKVRPLNAGAGSRVAYIDTGVDPDHPALRPWLDPGFDLVANRSVSEFDGLSTDTVFLLDTDTVFLLDKRFQFLLNHNLISTLNSGNSATDFPPAFGHGTLVAGIIHAVAPLTRILPIKAFDAYGYTNLFNIIRAVQLAIDSRVDVLNMSFSTPEDSVTLRKIISTANSAGMLVVASAGNDGIETSAAYPASFAGVYGVAASDFNDKLASFSNYGAVASITAPGAYVVSTVPRGRYAAAWGTSFSAPIVSGAIALLASQGAYGRSGGPLVLTTADAIDALNPGFERKLGKGRLNIKRAVAARR